MQWWCAAQGVPWTWGWQPYPGVWLFVLALAGLFRLLRRRFPEEDRPGFRAWMYGLGVAALWIALDWPVGALGAGYLASVHMVQYLLIALIAPPLLLVGLPRGLYAALDRGVSGRVLAVLSHPLAAMALFVGIMAWTHWPPVVDTLMVTQAGSFLLDLLWLFSGLAFWWPVAAPRPDRAWLQEGGKVAYLIVATLVNTGVFAYLTFSPLPLYATYELAPPVTGLSTRDDQLLAGLFMKMGGAVILWTAITILFFRWYRRSEEGSATRVGAVGALLLATAVVSCAGDGGPADGLAAGPLRVTPPVMGLPTVPGQGAAYLVLHNPSPDTVVVAGARVPGATTSLHRTAMSDGMMRMRPVARLALAPGETVRLEPGGLHLMVEGLAPTLAVGDSLALHLLLEPGPGVPGSDPSAGASADAPAGVAPPDGEAVEVGPLSLRVVPLDSLEAVLGSTDVSPH